MNETEIVLIDLSSIAHPIWHMCGSNPDQDACATQIVSRVRALASGHKAVAICCDSGKSFRHDISSAYKANRPEQEAALHHQITLAKERLAADGFPIWAVSGFEADDVIATATGVALEHSTRDVLIVSADKDLLQLVSPRVRAMSSNNGTVYDADAVVAKFGVKPEQMRDYLTLVGDASDNIKGAKGIGGKRAAELLAKFGSLDAIYRDRADHGPGWSSLPAGLATALTDFEPQLSTTRSLVTLRQDVEIPFDEVLAERVPKEATAFAMEDEDMEPETTTNQQPTEQPQPGQSIAVREPDAIISAPDWERGLDPRSMKEARLLAKDLYDSRMFSAYGTPQGVLSTIMVGRELGLPAMASLRCIYNLEGKHALSAALMAALVLKSGFAEYFEPVEFDDQHATFETKRKGARNPVKLTHTFEMAKTAWPKAKPDWEKSFMASGWGKNPTDMLVARAQSRLARLVYPDLLANLYTPEELKEAREMLVEAVA